MKHCEKESEADKVVLISGENVFPSHYSNTIFKLYPVTKLLLSLSLSAPTTIIQLETCLTVLHWIINDLSMRYFIITTASLISFLAVSSQAKYYESLDNYLIESVFLSK